VRLFIVLAALVAAVAFSAPASASHQHWLQTPAGCKEDVASGQTRKEEGEPGGHKFHYNVHTGTPGTHAFSQEQNPVSVGRDSCP
jgi:hypothetical protein